MKKEEKYIVGIIERGRKIKFVTSIEPKHYAKWEQGKEAIEFSKEYAEEMCIGFAWNGYFAVPILKKDYWKYENLEEKKEK